MAGDIGMEKVDAERGAMLCAAHFIAGYESLLPSHGGRYAADYDTEIDGIPVTLSCTCFRAQAGSDRIRDFRFRIEGTGGGEGVEVGGDYLAACKLAAHFINAYLGLSETRTAAGGRRSGDGLMPSRHEGVVKRSGAS